MKIDVEVLTRLHHEEGLCFRRRNKLQTPESSEALAKASDQYLSAGQALLRELAGQGVEVEVVYGYLALQKKVRPGYHGVRKGEEGPLCAPSKRLRMAERRPETRVSCLACLCVAWALLKEDSL